MHKWIKPQRADKKQCPLQLVQETHTEKMDISHIQRGLNVKQTAQQIKQDLNTPPLKQLKDLIV